MQPYQEEYIANLKDIAVLAARKKTEGCSFEDYSAKLASDREQIERKIVRNMELLRAGLFRCWIICRRPERRSLPGCRNSPAVFFR